MTDQILFAALDVSLETTAICIVDADGAIRREISVQTEPEAIAVILEPDRGQMARIGLEAGPLSEWLSDGLARLGFNVVLMETRQVRAALSAMVVKTDRKDARGMAQLLRAGWFRPVHVKTPDAREQRALLSARSTLVARLRDIENSLRGLLRGFGLRIPAALEAGGRERSAIASKATPRCWRSSSLCSQPGASCRSNSASSTPGSARRCGWTRSVAD